MTQMITDVARQSNSNGGALAKRQSALASMAERFAIEPSRLMEVLKATVIKGGRDRVATNEEVAAFIVVANQYRLNPLTREIHAFCDPQRGVVPIVGIDGWAHIVNEEPRFDGCEFEDAKDGDDVGISCTMYVQGRSHPVRVTEWLKECKRDTKPWNTMPRRMLRHKAFMQAARYAFSISGIYDEDEARDIINNVGAGPIVSDQTSSSRTENVLKKIASRPIGDDQFEPDASAIAQVEQEQSAGDASADRVTHDAGKEPTDSAIALETESTEHMGKAAANRIMLKEMCEQDWSHFLDSWNQMMHGKVDPKAMAAGLRLMCKSVPVALEENANAYAKRLSWVEASLDGRVNWEKGLVLPAKQEN